MLASSRPPEYTIQELPDSKEALEEYVLERGRSSATEGHPFVEIINSAGRTTESSFDFTAGVQSESHYLELMEFAPLNVFGGSYRDIPLSYVQGAMADLYVEMVMRKSRKYGAGTYDRLHLMTYCTDDRLSLVDEVFSLAGMWFSRNDHAFRSVHHVVPKASDSRIHCVFPASQDSSEVDESRMRTRAILQGDLRRASPAGDRSVTVPLRYPPWNGERKTRTRARRARGKKPK